MTLGMYNLVSLLTEGLCSCICSGSLLRYDTRKASSWTVFAWDEESFTVTCETWL